MHAYEWPKVKNTFHCDGETDQKARVPRAVCQGTIFLSYVSGMIGNVS